MVDEKGSDQVDSSRHSDTLEISLNKLTSHVENGFQSIDQNLKSLEAKLASAFSEGNAQVSVDKGESENDNGEPDNDNSDTEASPLSSTNGNREKKDETIIVQRMNDLERQQKDLMKQMENKVTSFIEKWNDGIASMTSASIPAKPSTNLDHTAPENDMNKSLMELLTSRMDKMESDHKTWMDQIESKLVKRLELNSDEAANGNVDKALEVQNSASVDSERKEIGVSTQSKDASTSDLQSLIKDSMLNLEKAILTKIGRNESVTCEEAPLENMKVETQSVGGEEGDVHSELKAIRETMVEQQKKVEEIGERVQTALDKISQHLGDTKPTKLEGSRVRDHVESFGENVNGDGERPSQRRRSMGVVELDDRESFRRMKGGMERLKFLLGKEQEMQMKVRGNKEMLTAACKRWYNRHVVAVHHCYHTCHGGDAAEFLLKYGDNFKTNGFKCACSEGQQVASSEEHQEEQQGEQGEQQGQI